MSPEQVDRLKDSAFDFLRIVWPILRQPRWLGGGDLIPVEAVTNREFNRDLDMLSGIDAWHVLRDDNAIRGIASRVQPMDHPYRLDKNGSEILDRAGAPIPSTPWDTFTIRYATRYGNPTEYQKRLHALDNGHRGFLYPHITTQAYVSKPSRGGQLLSVAMVRTTTLFDLARQLVETREGEGGLWGFRQVCTGRDAVMDQLAKNPGWPD